MSSTEEYQQSQFWDNLKLELEFNKQKELLLQDLYIFGKCIYQIEPVFKRINPSEYNNAENNK